MGLLFNIPEASRASNFKIYYNAALDSLYISTGNDITVYFRSAVNGINYSASVADKGIMALYNCSTIIKVLILDDAQVAISR